MKRQGCVTLMLLLIGAFAARVARADDPAAVTPERVKSAVAALDKLAADTLRRTGVPGIAVAVVAHDKVVFLKGYGVREAGKPAPIDADTVFQLASVSKPITSTVLAALVGEKKFGWDDRVIDRDPGFCLYDAASTRELRVRDLLCHRSSLPDHCGDLLEDLGYDRATILHRLRYQPPDSSFRAAYAYTNFGYTEGALCGALAAGTTWEDLAREKLYAPLGMKSTSSRFVDYAQAPNRALLHSLVDGKWVAKNTRQPDAQSPAGGVSSTLNDITRWLRLSLAEGKFEGRQIVDPAALFETHSPQIVTNFDPQGGRMVTYGLGWIVEMERGGRVLLKHSGGFDLGMRTEVALLPADEIGIAVFSNAGPTGIPEAIVESFFDLLFDGKVQRDWVEFANRMFALQIEREAGERFDYSQPPVNPVAPAENATYTAKYRNDFFGEIEIAARQGVLQLLLGPKKQPFPLKHWNRDVFTYEPTGEMAAGTSGVTFLVGPSGKADRVLLENLNIHGMGTFARITNASK
ncbi:MAG: serine hydrolase [Pirellulales bacterium]|nr:serine hydrolase [Pirellulales bacterium]